MSEEKPKTIMQSFNELEDQQSLHRLNNKQKSIDVVAQEVIEVTGFKYLSLTDSICKGFFSIKKKRNFDISIIISNDEKRKNWYLLNLTYSELRWFCKNHKIETDEFTDFIKLLFEIFQTNFEDLLTFKNSTKNFSRVKFNLKWIGIISLEDYDPLDFEHSTDDWNLFYT